jgi:hypothetical protein
MRSILTLVTVVAAFVGLGGVASYGTSLGVASLVESILLLACCVVVRDDDACGLDGCRIAAT